MKLRQRSYEGIPRMLGKLFCALSKALGGCQLDPLLTIKPIGTIDLHEMSSILLDKLEEMGDAQAEIYLPDNFCKVYDKEEVKRFLHLDETDKIPYVREEFDCDDFTAKLFEKFAGLVWTNVHALNWFVDREKTLWFIEPQQDKIAKDLENWQGYEIQFFLGR